LQFFPPGILISRKMNLRPATAADLALLRHWDEQPHVIAASPNDDWGWEVELNRSPDWREQLIAELDGRPVGFVQIIDPAREESPNWVTYPRTACHRYLDRRSG
jgi:aminoglycoside 6'-N-acetyltransferase